MTIEELHQIYLKCSKISIDTRTIAKNDLFFALKGENYDANSFANEALQKGAAFVVIDNEAFFTDKQKMILVANTLVTLQELAKFHRIYLGLKVIALTGSNGKTTTKELIHKVLSKKYNTQATMGNLNNHIGVPLTLLSFNTTTQIGIVEMGANHQNEIAFLSEIAQPDFGYITNFGKAHLEGFGGIEGVIKGKSELISYIENNNKTMFVNLDDEIQDLKTKKITRYTFSKEKTSDVFVEEILANPLVSIKIEKEIFKSNLIGLYNANNIIAAITIGKYFKVSYNQIMHAIEEYIPTNNRSQIISKNSNEIILDAYNANPSSMKAAILNFYQLTNKNKIVILGDMFELGSESKKEHLEIINLIKIEPSVETYFIGKEFYSNKISQKRMHFFETFEDFLGYFQNIIFTNSTILIKGSRGMSLERVLNYIS